MPLIGYVFLFCLIPFSGLFPHPAQAQPDLRYAPPAEERVFPYTGLVPACWDPSVLTQIAWDFRDRETSYWASDLAIVGFVETRETGYRSNGASYIPRRYCAALADFNDGLRRSVGYNVGERLGFSSLGWGVEWCVVGLDRDFSFAPHCKMTQP